MKNTRVFFRKSSFTLLEIIVAMGVFSLLMAMTMQFFSGAQRIWSSSESRNTVYSDARVAMDLMATLLQATYFKVDTTPFVINANGNNDTYKIYFFTKSGLRPRGNTSLFCASFQVDDQHTLKIVTICDEDTVYKNLFVIAPNKRTQLVQKLDNDIKNNTNTTEIIPNVTTFKITPGVNDYGNQKIDWTQDATTDTTEPFCPSIVKIELGILPDPYFERWKNASGSVKDDILKEQEKKFTRFVYIGDRN